MSEAMNMTSAASLCAAAVPATRAATVRSANALECIMMLDNQKLRRSRGAVLGSGNQAWAAVETPRGNCCSTGLGCSAVSRTL